MENFNGWNRTANNSSLCSDGVLRSVHWLHSFGQLILLYLLPVLSVIGIASNTVVCVVLGLRRTEIHGKGKVMYAAIAAADSLQLASSALGRVLYVHSVRIGLIQSTADWCRALVYLSNLTLALSNSYSAMFAIERCVSVYRLSRVDVTRKHLLLVIATVTLLQALVCLPTVGILQSPGNSRSHRVCEITPKALADLGFIVSQLFTLHVPCFLLLASDCALLNFLLRRSRTAFKLTKSPSTATEADFSDHYNGALVTSGNTRLPKPNSVSDLGNHGIAMDTKNRSTKVLVTPAGNTRLPNSVSDLGNHGIAMDANRNTNALVTGGNTRLPRSVSDLGDRRTSTVVTNGNHVATGSNSKLPSSVTKVDHGYQVSNGRTKVLATSCRMKTIIGNTRACVVMSTLRCVFLFSGIAMFQLSFATSYHTDFCLSDILYSVSMIVLSASALLLSSNLYILLWRVRAFNDGFRRLCSRSGCGGEDDFGDAGPHCSAGFRSLVPSNSAV